MHKSVEELTKKIYQEGVEKAEAKGENIVNDAKRKAQDIVASAEAKAREIIENAEKSAADLKVKQESEMRLASRQALGLLKQRITDLLIWEVTEEPVKSAFQDGEFVKRLIEKLVDFWLANFAQEDHLEILLPEEDVNNYQQYLGATAQEWLKKGVKVEFKGTMKDGFAISPADGRFKVSFTSEDFENYFKTFARPRTFKLLYGEE